MNEKTMFFLDSLWWAVILFWQGMEAFGHSGLKCRDLGSLDWSYIERIMHKRVSAQEPGISSLVGHLGSDQGPGQMKWLASWLLQRVVRVLWFFLGKTDQPKMPAWESTQRWTHHIQELGRTPRF